MRHALIALAAAALAACNSATTEQETPGPGEPTLAQVRESAARFQDINVALAEGYIRDPTNTCETATMMGRPAEDGAMGVHYFHPGLLGIAGPPDPRVDGTSTYTDFRAPAILIYEPQADGSMELVAVENLVFKASWAAAGNSSPPTFHGRPYDAMEDDPATDLDEAHGFAPHYDRHVWIFRENPRGVFQPFNPAVTCEHHTGAHAPM